MYFRNGQHKKEKLDDMAQPLKYRQYPTKKIIESKKSFNDAKPLKSPPIPSKKMSNLLEKAKIRQQKRKEEQKALINAINAINTDDENEGFECAAWKKRELKRLKRDKKSKPIAKPLTSPLPKSTQPPVDSTQQVSK